MRHYNKFWLVLMAVVLFGIVPTSIAFAHGRLELSEPPLGASVEVSPEQFHLIFTERIDAGFTNFILQDGSGVTIEELAYELEEEERHVIVAIATVLDEGAYQIHWSMLSKDDGHPSEGLIPFFVGMEAVTEIKEEPETLQENPPIFRVLIRGIGLTAMLILVGSLFFPLLLNENFQIEQQKNTHILWISIVVLLGTGYLDVWLQSQQLSSTIWKVITESRWGQLQLAKYVVLAMISALFVVGYRTMIFQWSARVTALILLVATSLASHSAGQGWVGVLADWTHLFAAALWLGGITQLMWVWFGSLKKQSIEERTPALTTLLARFSQLALISVVLLIVSGVYATVLHVQTWDALFSSIYGQSIVLKVFFLSVIVAIAVPIRFIFLPQLLGITQVNSDAKTVEITENNVLHLFEKIRTFVSAEAMLIFVTLFFASVLTLASPPHQNETALPEPSRHIFETVLDEVEVKVVINNSENKGEKVFLVDAAFTEEGVIADLQRVTLRFKFLDADLGEVVLEPIAEKIDEGKYRVEGPYLNIPGNWELLVLLRMRGRPFDIESQFLLEISPIGHIERIEQENDTNE